MKQLPRCFVWQPLVNPDWKSEGDVYYLPPALLEVEILTLHFNTRKMRVRFVDKSISTSTWDTDITPFFEAYAIQKIRCRKCEIC